MRDVAAFVGGLVRPLFMLLVMMLAAWVALTPPMPAMAQDCDCTGVRAELVAVASRQGELAMRVAAVESRTDERRGEYDRMHASLAELRATVATSGAETREAMREIQRSAGLLGGGTGALGTGGALAVAYLIRRRDEDEDGGDDG